MLLNQTQDFAIQSIAGPFPEPIIYQSNIAQQRPVLSATIQCALIPVDPEGAAGRILKHRFCIKPYIA